jgi:hypothetical protein
MPTPSSGLKNKPGKLQEASMKKVAGEISDFCLIHADFLLRFFLSLEGGSCVCPECR